jgi:hypothetical protein
MKLKNFIIDETCFTSISVRTVYSPYADRESLTPEELIDALTRDLEHTVMYSSEDHPEFNRLRCQLEDLGYIKVQRAWWNGDEVLKSFKLNNNIFRKNDRFPCADAMAGHMKFFK